MLVFDDLGAEKLTNWVEEQFYLLIDHRYRQRLLLLASSSFSTSVLVQRLHRRVLDRLRETCVVIEVTGPNQRDQVMQRGNHKGQGWAKRSRDQNIQRWYRSQYFRSFLYSFLLIMLLLP